ncbi:MAG: HD domain-containing phosphohydrolase, partial [Bdellovibrionales bacterium]
FIASQKIKSSYFPIKADEIREQTQLNFTVLHVMPLNRKFIPIFNSGDEVTGEKAKKLKSINEVYIRREDIEAYRDYLQKFDDKSAAALGRRCRAQFLTLYSSFVDLVFMISDQSEAGSFKLGSELYQKCSSLASELLTTLSATGNAWAIINNSAIGESSSLQRAPAWAAYAGLLSLQSGIGQPVDVMTACLLCDLGMLELNPKVGALTRELSLNEKAYEKWHPEDQNEYFSHPIKGLNLALSRKLPIPDLVKSIILSSHERVDQKGFPHKILPEKIPLESMILQISEILDKKSQIQMGRENKPIALVKQEIFEEHMKDSGQLSRLFLEKIRGSLMDI